MKLMASFVMRGRSQAVMTATVLAMLSLLFPPLSILSSAVIALVTLRKGLVDGGWVLGLSALACGLLALLLLGSALPVFGFLSFLWLPVWLLAVLYRSSRSMALTIEAALALGLVIIVGQYLQNPEPIAGWRDLLRPFTASLVEMQLVDQAQSDMLLETMASWMPGMVAAGFMLQSMAALLLARWWQAVLYNPGGFRAEFHQLRLHRVTAVLTLLVVGLNLVMGTEQAGLLSYLSMLLLAAWFLQGLALVHAVLGRLKGALGWLVGVYVLLLLAMPHMVTVLAAAGFTDSWFDFRARFRASTGAGGAG